MASNDINDQTVVTQTEKKLLGCKSNLCFHYFVNVLFIMKVPRNEIFTYFSLKYEFNQLYQVGN